MSVLEAENGQEALTLFNKQQPDLVFLDVDMPLLNGFEVCQAIRQTERGPIVTRVNSDGGQR